MQFTLDSIFLYAKQVYLWNDALPSYDVFNPRSKYGSISPELNAFKAELLDISQLKNNPATGKPYELPVTSGKPKYSYLQNGRSVPGRNAGSATAGLAVLKSLVISSGQNKIAYLALGSFPDLSTCKTELENAFAGFTPTSPRHVVIDLRSNTGGYVETAEYVANLLAPSTLNGKVIFSERFNSQMQGGKATILKHQPYLDDEGKPVIYKGREATMADVDFTENGNTYKFSKKGSLETVTDVYFIVSGHTASASELLISSLKPYFNVRLVGEKTYGKPVGFFGINIDQYSIYLSSFLVRNAQGWSDYFEGMEPDVRVAMPSDPALGDPHEPCLKKVLELINGVQVPKNEVAPNARIMQANPNTKVADKDSVMFVPMIEHRLKLKQ